MANKECKTVIVRGKRRTLCWAPTGKRRCYDVYGIVSNKAAGDGRRRGPHKAPGKGKAYNLVLARPKGRQSPGGGIGGLGSAFKRGKGGRKVLRKGCRFLRGGRVSCKKD